MRTVDRAHLLVERGHAPRLKCLAHESLGALLDKGHVPRLTRGDVCRNCRPACSTRTLALFFKRAFLQVVGFLGHHDVAQRPHVCLVGALGIVAQHRAPRGHLGRTYGHDVLDGPVVAHEVLF